MIQTELARLTALAAGGAENNPAILWDNLFSSSAAATSVGTEQPDGAAANSVTGTTFDYWSASESGGYAACQFDLGATGSLTCVALAAHNIGTLGGYVRIQTSQDGVSWTTMTGNVQPSDDSAIMFRFPATAARYWRVQIFGLATSDVVSIAVIMGGTEMILPRRVYQGYAPPITPTEVTTSTNVSVSGHLIGVLSRRAGSSAAAQLQNMPAEYMRGDWAAFQRHANAAGGFFWSWRPAKYGDCHFAWATAPIVPVNSGPRDLMSVRLQLGMYDG